MNIENDNKTIKQRLTNVQKLILENRQLQEQFPERKRSLLLSLKSLKFLEEEIVNELKREEVIKNTEIYEVIFDSDEMKDNTIPSEKLGHIFIDNQHAVEVFAHDPLPMNGLLKSEITLNTRLDVLAFASSSFKVIFTSKQKVLTDIDDAKTPIRDALNKMQEIISCSDDDEKLEAMTKKFGKKQINQYKKLAETLYETNIDMEFKGVSKKKGDYNIFKLKAEDSKKIFNVLNKEPIKSEDTFDLTGVLTAVDCTNKYFFKIKGKLDSQEKTITVGFDKKFEKDIKKIFADSLILKVKVERITKLQSFDRSAQVDYNLLDILE